MGEIMDYSKLSDEDLMVLTNIIVPGEASNNISVRQNNPFNLKYAGQEGAEKGARDFAAFPSTEAGIVAGLKQIKLDQSRSLNLSQFINKYAPPNENDTTGYIKDVANLTGTTPNTPLKHIDTVALAKAVAKRESSVDLPTEILSKMVGLLGPSSAEAGDNIRTLSDEDLLKQVQPKQDLSKTSDDDLLKQVNQPAPPIMSTNEYKEGTKGFTNTPIDRAKESILVAPEQIFSGLRTLVDWPHEHISNPIAEKLVSKTGLPETQDVPLDVMVRPGEFGQVGGTPVEGNIQAPLGDLAKNIVTGGLDIPVYGGALRAVTGVGTALENLLPKTKGLYTPVEAAIEAIVPKGPSLDSLLNEGVIKSYEAKTFPSTIQPELETVGKGKKVKEVLNPAVEQFPIEEKLTPAKTEQIVSAQGRENQSIIDAAPTLWNREQMRWLRSGGPTTEEMQQYFSKHLSEGGTVSSAVEAISSKFKIAPEEAAKTIRNIGQTSLGSVDNIAAQKVKSTSAVIDTTNMPLAQAISGPDFKASLPSLRDVGVDVPNIPPMPYSINNVENTTPKGNLNQAKAELLSPSIVSRNLFEGDGPILDWMKGWHQTLFEQAYHRRFLNNNFEPLLNDVKASKEAMGEILGPLSRRLEESLTEYKVSQSDLSNYRALLSKQARGSAAAQETQAKITEIENQLTQNAVKTKTGQPSTNLWPKAAVDIEDEARSAIAELQKQHANIRIQMAVEGDATAQSLLSAEEKQIADRLGASYKQFGDRMTQQGMPTLSGSYGHHIYHWAGYDTDTGLKAFADKLWWQKDTTPQLLTFLSREGALNWFPSAYDSFDAYVGAATRKLAFNPWYAKWTPAMDRWDAANMGNTSKWLRDFLGRNMTSQSADWGDKIVNGLVNFEYGHYLLGNFSPAILHAFKVLQTPAYWGLGATGKGVGQYAEAVGSKMGGGKSSNLRAIEFYNMTPQLIQELEQSPAWAGTFQPSFWQKLRGNPILNPTRLTEHFDRGVQTLASISVGEKAGATSNTMNNAIMDSLLKMNFYGWDSPPFMQQHRALTMFQQQPWKLAEMKGQLIRDAIMGESDPYGHSMWPKLARMAVILGGAGVAGSLVGLDLTKHVGSHIPFTTDTMSGGHGPAIAPVVGDLTTLKSVFDEGWEKGLKQYLSYGGVVQKAIQEKIPDRYNGSRAQWMLGIPSSGWREGAKEKSENIQNRLKRRTLRAAALHGEDVTPFNFLQSLTEEK